MHRVLVLSGLVLALSMPPAFAATTVQDVVSKCAVSNTASAKTECRAAIAAYIQGLGLTGADLDEALGQLAYSLATASGLSATTGAVIADALDAISTSISDPQLKRTVESIAADATDGSVTVPANAPSPRNPSGG